METDTLSSWSKFSPTIVDDTLRVNYQTQFKYISAPAAVSNYGTLYTDLTGHPHWRTTLSDVRLDTTTDSTHYATKYYVSTQAGLIDTVSESDSTMYATGVKNLQVNALNLRVTNPRTGLAELNTIQDIGIGAFPVFGGTTGNTGFELRTPNDKTKIGDVDSIANGTVLTVDDENGKLTATGNFSVVGSLVATNATVDNLVTSGIQISGVSPWSLLATDDVGVVSQVTPTTMKTWLNGQADNGYPAWGVIRTNSPLDTTWKGVNYDTLTISADTAKLVTVTRLADSTTVLRGLVQDTTNLALTKKDKSDTTLGTGYVRNHQLNDSAAAIRTSTWENGESFTPVTGGAFRGLSTGSTIRTATNGGTRKALYSLFQTSCGDTNNLVFSIDHIDTGHTSGGTLGLTGMQVRAYYPPDNGGDVSNFLGVQTGGGSAGTFYKVTSLRPTDFTDYWYSPQGGVEAATDGGSQAIIAIAGVFGSVHKSIAVIGRTDNDSSQAFLAQPQNNVFDSRVAYQVGSQLIGSPNTNVHFEVLMDGTTKIYNDILQRGLSPSFVTTSTVTNTDVSTTAQMKDTSASSFSFTNSGKPLLDMKGITGNQILAVDSTGSLGLGVASPNLAGSLEMYGTPNFVGAYFSNNASAFSLLGLKARGTTAAPASPNLDDNLISIGGGGYDSTTMYHYNKGLISINAAENWTSTKQGTYINFQTTALGTTTRAGRMKLTEAGTLTIPSATPKWQFFADGSLTGSALLRGSDAFTTTATADTVAITGAAATDYYWITLTGTAAPSANDACTVQATATGFILHRSASGTSGLTYNWLRMR